MGSGSWSSTDWSSYTTKTSTAPVDKIYSTRGKALKSLDPKGLSIRESRDSVDNPLSTPIIVGVDVTGSMGMIAETIARKGLGTLFQEILDRKPVTDPHVMFMGVGDAACDTSPLQVSQFEADNRIVEQLTGIFLEGGGGGNGFESYNLPWYFAAMHTATDSFEKRNKKGYLFTIGDEPPPPSLLADHIKSVFGDEAVKDIPSKELIAMAEKMYHVFHVVVKEGNGMSGSTGIRGVKEWNELLGRRVLMLSDHTKLSEVIVSAIEITEGRDKTSVIKSWSGDTSLVVSGAISGLTAYNKSASNKVVKF